MNKKFTIESGKLVISDTETGKTLWSGNFNGYPVFKLLPLQNGEDCLVLLDPGASKQPTFENLLKVTSSGEVTWKASLPHSHDAYTDVVLKNKAVEATTWCGSHVLVNPSNGITQKIGFSK